MSGINDERWQRERAEWHAKHRRTLWDTWQGRAIVLAALVIILFGIRSCGHEQRTIEVHGTYEVRPTR